MNCYCTHVLHMLHGLLHQHPELQTGVPLSLQPWVLSQLSNLHFLHGLSNPLRYPKFDSDKVSHHEHKLRTKYNFLYHRYMGMDCIGSRSNCNNWWIKSVPAYMIVFDSVSRCQKTALVEGYLVKCCL